MALIQDPDLLNIGTEITINTGAAHLHAGGSERLLTLKSNLDMNALWSFFVDKWATTTCKPFPFPMNKVDNRLRPVHLWPRPWRHLQRLKPAGDTTRQVHCGRLGSTAMPVLNRVYFGAVLQGGVSAGSQCYYQRRKSVAQHRLRHRLPAYGRCMALGMRPMETLTTRTFFSRSPARMATPSTMFR